MSLLLDRMLAFGFTDERAQPVQFGVLKEIPALLAQTASDYFYMGSSQEYWHLRDDYPCVLPPWPQCWLEYREPPFKNSHGKIIPTPVRATVGVALSTRRPAELPVLGEPGDRLRAILDDAAWVVQASPVLEVGRDIRVANRFSWTVCLDVDGRVMEGKRAHGAMPGEIIEMVHVSEAWRRIKGSEAEASAAEFVRALIQPIFFALSLLHCRNVEVEKIHPPAKLSAAHQRRHGRPLLRYHILNVDPFRTVAAKVGGGVSGMKRALHICRGSFAEYTAEAPLFGKYTGRFWRPMHTKGAMAQGVVGKDYRIRRAVAGPTTK